MFDELCWNNLETVCEGNQSKQKFILPLGLNTYTREHILEGKEFSNYNLSDSRTRKGKLFMLPFVLSLVIHKFYHDSQYGTRSCINVNYCIN